MSENGNLQADPLFLGLTRPTMFLGVSMMFVILEAFVGLIYFIQFADFKAVPMVASIHMVGYIICFKEPLFVELFLMYTSKCKKCNYFNRTYHGANSYDVY